MSGVAAIYNRMDEMREAVKSWEERLTGIIR